MTHASSGGRGGSRRRPVLRHHLEDDFDRELDRLHGSGRSRERDRARRARQYEHLASRLLEAFLDRELTEPGLDGLGLAGLHLHPGGAVMTVHVTVDRSRDPSGDGYADVLRADLEQRIRAELCRELPRRRTPDVRVVVVPGRGGAR